MAADPAETATIVTLADGFHVRQAVDNIAWIDMGDHAVAVDALEEPDLADEVFRAIESTLGDKPVRYLLNTHTHCDHVALNEAFRRRCGTEIINQATTPVGPEGRWFAGARRRLLMLPMPGCHTNEDCLVWAPDDKVLFVGDLFGWGLIPLPVGLTDEAAGLLLDTHARLIDYDARGVVPGHGPVCTTAELKRWVAYFTSLRREVARACAAGKSDAEIRRQLAPPADMAGWWRFVLWKHADSLDKVLRGVRGGRLTA